jgi:glutamate-1-semialdehyde 2,1-aminomutase
MTDRFAGSRRQHERSRHTLAGGVATAFRAGQQPVPVCFVRGEDAHLWDVDGNRYVDYNLAFGPMLQGHSPLPVIDAVQRQLVTGLGYGASHPLEAELAETVCRVVPSAEQVIFNSTGSEAVHIALRIARSATGRRRVIKFAGHYHGWFDPIHIGLPGQADRAPGTGGQDPEAAASIIVCPWNDVAALRAALTPEVAAVIMEPVNVNGGCILPGRGYLAEVRDMTRRAGAVLIFDEVITGFRMALGGAQGHYGITPDLTVLGKALGGGFPVSAVCGSRSVMEEVSTARVAHVGTFNLNPVCAAAALAAVGELERSAGDLYPRLGAMTGALADLVAIEARAAGLSLTVNHTIGAAHASAAREAVETHEDAAQSDTALYRRFVAALLEHGVHTIPRGTWFMSTVHTDSDLETTRRAVRAAASSVTALVPSGGM